MEHAIDIVQKADLLLIVGTSMLVYPAAGLIDFAQSIIPIHYVDPNPGYIYGVQKTRVVLHQTVASEGVCRLVSQWMQP
jgi:NAD-dependent deacetylase